MLRLAVLDVEFIIEVSELFVINTFRKFRDQHKRTKNVKSANKLIL